MNRPEGLGPRLTPLSNMVHYRPLPTVLERLRGHGNAGCDIAQRLLDAHDMITEREALSGCFASAQRRQHARLLAASGRQLWLAASAEAELLLAPTGQSDQ